MQSPGYKMRKITSNCTTINNNAKKTRKTYWYIGHKKNVVHPYLNSGHRMHVNVILQKMLSMHTKIVL